MEVYSKEFIRILVQSNFINMLKSRNLQELKEFKSNPNAMKSLFQAMGASEETISQPAHSQMLEKLVGEMLDGIQEALEDTRANCGCQVQFDKDNNLIVNIESFSTQDKYKLSFTDNEYAFRKNSIRTGSSSEERTVQGKDKQILDYKESSYYDGKNILGRKLFLDEHGFVTTEKDGIKEKKYKYSSQGFGREENVEIKKVSISRDNKTIINREGKTISWNGDPLNLNEDEESPNQIYLRAVRNIKKCPKVQDYYEQHLGMSFEEILRDLKSE